MKGSDLISALEKQLGVSGIGAVAEQVGYSAVRLHQLKNEQATPRIVAQLVTRAKAKSVVAASTDIKPIVEFFPLWKEGRANQFLELAHDDQKALKTALNATGGVYSFYNSELEIIYIGRTKKRALFQEMCGVLDREMTHYQRYKVAHPAEKYKATADGKVRPIRRDQVSLYEAASYFSAYAADQDVARILEAIMIRMLPNDLLNVRMEGQSLTQYAPPEISKA